MENLSSNLTPSKLEIFNFCMACLPMVPKLLKSHDKFYWTDEEFKSKDPRVASQRGSLP